jgi:hypothetical protein
MMKHALALAALVMLGLATTASASITIYDGAGGVQPDENIVFNGSGVVVGPGSTVTGRTNQNSYLLDMFSSSVIAANEANGQAKVVSGVDDGTFADLSFGNFRDPSGPTPLTIRALEFNILADIDGFVTIDVWYDPLGVGVADETLTTELGGNGQNFFSVFIDSDNEAGFGLVKITSLNPGNNFSEVRQIRIEAVPEPASLLVWSLIGLGAIPGAVLYRRRKS